MNAEEIIQKAAERLRNEGRGRTQDGYTGHPNSFTMSYYEEGPNARHTRHVTARWLAEVALSDALKEIERLEGNLQREYQRWEDRTTAQGYAEQRAEKAEKEIEQLQVRIAAYTVVTQEQSEKVGQLQAEVEQLQAHNRMLVQLDDIGEAADTATEWARAERLQAEVERQKKRADGNYFFGEQVKQERDEAVAVLRQIRGWGVQFDAKGTHSKRVVEAIAEALARLEGTEQ